MGQETRAVPYVPHNITINGLPEHLHEVATLLDTVRDFPDDLQSLTPEQTKVVADLIASLASPEVQILFEQEDGPEEGDESVIFPMSLTTVDA